MLGALDTLKPKNAMSIVYRLAKEEYKEDLSGYGSYKYGGRWNSKGSALLYTSDSKALCLAEIIVHFDLGICPEDYYLLEIWIPDDQIEYLSTNDLPYHWHSFPYNLVTRKIGDSFISNGKYLCVRVPSAVVQGDFNYLINPDHAAFNKVKIVSSSPFPIDERLFSFDRGQ